MSGTSFFWSFSIGCQVARSEALHRYWQRLACQSSDPTCGDSGSRCSSRVVQSSLTELAPLLGGISTTTCSFVSLACFIELLTTGTEWMEFSAAYTDDSRHERRRNRTGIAARCWDWHYTSCADVVRHFIAGRLRSRRLQPGWPTHQRCRCVYATSTLSSSSFICFVRSIQQ